MFGHKKGLEKKLIEGGGTIAWATVLEGKEKWSSASGQGYYGPSKVTEHMRLQLRVEPQNEPTFEAELSQAFAGLPPMTGCQCKVVYDPADRTKIVVIEGSVIPPGISHEQAERAAARHAEAAAAAKNGTMAQYIEEQKAKAMRGALGGTAIVDGRMVSGDSAGAQLPSTVDQLAKLADLRDRGALTDAEFEAQKAKLLAQS